MDPIKAIEIKKKIAEMWRVHSAKLDQEVRIAEKLQEIERLKESMTKSDDHNKKLREEILAMGGDPAQIPTFS